MDILALGSIYLDINSLHVPFLKSIPVEKEIVGGIYDAVVGGSCSNFLRGCSSLGLETGVIGKVGLDNIGSVIEKNLSLLNIKSFLIKSPSVQSNMGINLVNDSGKRVMMVLGNSNESLEEKDFFNELIKLIPSIKYLYLGGFFKLLKLDDNFYTKLIEVAHQHKIGLIFDHGRVNNIVTSKRIESAINIVKHLSVNDYYLPSEEEFKQVWKISLLEKSLNQFSNISNAITVIKRSRRGCLCYYKGKYIEKNAYKIISVTNSVGSGDFFNAGLAAAVLHNLSLESSMEFANAFSAINISRGKSAGYAETISFLNDQGRRLT